MPRTGVATPPEADAIGGRVSALPVFRTRFHCKTWKGVLSLAASDSVRVELPGKGHNWPLSSLRRKTGLYSMPERAGQTLESRRRSRIPQRFTAVACIVALNQGKTKIQGNV